MIEARNNADALAYAAEKALRDLGEKVPANDRKNIEQKIADLREALKGDDLGKIKRLSEEVQQASYALSQQMYAAQSGQTGGAARRGGNGKDEGEVVEGEFHEA